MLWCSRDVLSQQAYGERGVDVDDVELESHEISKVAVFNDRKRQPHLRVVDHANRLQPKHPPVRVGVTRHGGCVHEYLVTSLLEIRSKRLDGHFDAVGRRQVAIREESDSQGLCLGWRIPALETRA